MILSLLFNLFFGGHLSLQGDEIAVVNVQDVSAAEPNIQIVQGFDETTSLPFYHTLPMPSTDVGGFGPQRITGNSLGVLTTADSALVIDERTSTELFTKNAQEVRPIASITKLMSALVLIDQGIDFQEVVTISPADYRAGGFIHYYTGEQFLVQDLWMGGLMASDNVAMVALVRNSGLTIEEFAAAMNNKAKELKMNNSFFVEPTGINSNNVSTAREVALLVKEAMSKTMITDVVRRINYNFKVLNKDSRRYLKNTNALLTSFINDEPYSILGGKTGFTYEAGYSLTVMVDGPGAADNIIVVVLGADTITDRFLEVKGLVDWTYENYRW